MANPDPDQAILEKNPIVRVDSKLTCYWCKRPFGSNQEGLDPDKHNIGCIWRLLKMKGSSSTSTTT